MKKLFLVCLCTFPFIICSCTIGEISIDKREYSESETLLVSEQIDDVKIGQQRAKQNEQIPDPAKKTKIGDRFLAKNLIMDGGSGEIYMTIESATAFYTLADAGITKDECSEMDEDYFDVKSGELKENYVFVLVNILLDNKNAISRAYAVEPEKYDQYDFRFDLLGACTDGPLTYTRIIGDVATHDDAFHLVPGETTTITCGYLVSLDHVSLKNICFETSATPKNGAIIELNLGG